MADTWELRFDNHPLWSQLNDLRTQLDSVGLPSDPQLSDAHKRILNMVTNIEAYKEAESGKDAITTTMFQKVYGSIQDYVSPSVGQYVSDPGSYASSLNSAAENVDTVYDALAVWPALSTKGRTIAAGIAAAQYVDASKEALELLENRFKQLKERVDEFEGYVQADFKDFDEKNKAALSVVKAESQAELQSVTEQATQLAEQIEAHNVSLTALTDATESAIEAKLAEADERIDSYTADRVGDALNELQSATESSVQGAKDDNQTVATLRDETESLTKETRNLAASFARKAVAEDYQKNARNKALAGWTWDVLGFAAGAIPLGFVLYHFMTVNDATGESVTSITLSRIGVSLAAIGIAALCFHRGSVNHKESRVAKRTDLRVRTVHPFLANLSPDTRKAVLEGMADQIFLQGKLEPGEAAESEGGEMVGLLKGYLGDVLERRKADSTDDE